MIRGTVLSIWIAPTADSPIVHVESAWAVPGRGLQGDRYFHGTGTWTGWPDSELTLIEWEAIQDIEREHDICLEPGDLRRNVVTRGVSLLDLVGRRFRLGALLVYGVRPCDPCRHIESVTQPGVLKALSGRGGLRARILEEGLLEVGSSVEVGE
ncbi:MAG: MOSC domain-containing protein [Chloroflexota bacterium]|nr:MOSC domain-containing protein [Chloroflexota bacterium]